MRVYNMLSPRTNKPVANQFIINDGENIYFQSYETIIAKKDSSGRITLDRDYYDYSRTTAKYRNAFLSLTTKETEARIKSGVILLDNLN